MRLLLHGRSTVSMLQSQLEQASRDIKTVRLSGWDFDEMDAGIIQALISYLQSLPAHQLEDVTLQNCTGQTSDLVEAIVRTSPRGLTIRYDKQQTELPLAITTGLIQGATSGSRLQSFKLRGVTLTVSVVESFRIALSQLHELTCLSIQSKFTLVELDRKHVSILGGNPQDADDVFYEMIRLLQELRHLTTLDLEHCHVADTYLAELLRAAYRRTCLHTLILRGNMAQHETMGLLSEWMLSKDCPLRHLDLSWQRQAGNSKSNCSPFAAQMPFLATALLHNKSLTSLRISENRLSDADVNHLVNALARNKTLRELDLKDCRISMDGMRSIAKQLPKFRLEKLDMNGCQQVEGTKLKSLFFKPLSQNVYLLDLVLPQIESKSLAWLLELNKAGRRVLVARPELPPSLWPNLLERADKVGRHASDRQPERHAATAIYYLIREKGFITIARQQERQQQQELQRQKQQQQQQQRPTLRARGLVTPPVTPRREDSTRRISPSSSFDSRTGLWSPSPAPSANSSSRSIGRGLLDESSSFDRDEPLVSYPGNSSSSNVKPSPNLARPQLTSSRKSSSGIPTSPRILILGPGAPKTPLLFPPRTTLPDAQ